RARHGSHRTQLANGSHGEVALPAPMLTSQASSAPESDSLRTRESLLSRLREWDNAAEWRVFFDTYWRLIFNFGRKSGLSEPDAQDLVQDVMVSMAKKLP